MQSTTTMAARLNYYLFLLAIALIVIGVRLILIDTYGVKTPYWDDWGMGGFLTKSVTEGLPLSDFFEGSNEHRLVFNGVLSLALFNLNHQQWDPLISMVANTVIWTVFCLFMVRLVLKQLETHQHILVLAVLLILFIYPLALVNVLWGIQTHNYTMILFSVWGCWYSTYTPLSAKWYFGIFCLAAASLTLAGGTFAAFSVVCMSLITLITDKDNRKEVAITLIAALLAGLFGLTLILVQSDEGTSQSLVSTVDFLVTVLKVMSWPNSTTLWPSLIFGLPIFILLFQYIKMPEKNSQITKFVITLYGFIVLIAIAIGYARGAGALGPARRYFEFLSLLPIASLMSFSLISSNTKPLFNKALGILLVIWLTVFISAAPRLQEVNDFTLAESKRLRPIQEELVRTYLNTKDINVLERKPFRHVPFPHHKKLAGMLDKMSAADTLPALLQTPKPLKWRPDIAPADIQKSAFMVNGTFLASSGTFKQNRVGEDVFGSYKPLNGGMGATGKFESEVFRINRSFASIPVQGYVGYPGLTLKLVDAGTGEEFMVNPGDLNSRNSEAWRTISMPIPRGYYRVVAEDNNKKLWFGFATPRSLGRLSYYTERLLDNSHWFWQIGLLMFLFSIRNQLLSIVIPKD